MVDFTNKYFFEKIKKIIFSIILMLKTIKIYYLWFTPFESKIIYLQGLVLRQTNQYFFILSGTKNNSITWKFAYKKNPTILFYKYF